MVMKRTINKKETKKKLTKRSKVSKKGEFEKVLQEIESRQDWGNGFWDLPANPTPSQLVKYELCEKILGYQEDNDLSDEKELEILDLLSKLLTSYDNRLTASDALKHVVFKNAWIFNFGMQKILNLAQKK